MSRGAHIGGTHSKLWATKRIARVMKCDRGATGRAARDLYVMSVMSHLVPLVAGLGKT